MLYEHALYQLTHYCTPYRVVHTFTSGHEHSLFRIVKLSCGNCLDSEKSSPSLLLNNHLYIRSWSCEVSLCWKQQMHFASIVFNAISILSHESTLDLTASRRVKTFTIWTPLINWSISSSCEAGAVISLSMLNNFTRKKQIIPHCKAIQMLIFPMISLTVKLVLMKIWSSLFSQG